MKRKLVSLLALCALLLSCTTAAYAQESGTYASTHIAYHYCAAVTGPSSGQVTFEFLITGTGMMSSIGVSKVVVYTADNTKELTLWGRFDNGLLAPSTDEHVSEYTFNGVSGQYYYAELTFHAANAEGADSIVRTTNLVKAP